MTQLPADVHEMEWVRLSAYIDGEGCICISSKNGGTEDHHMYVTVSNTDPRLMMWLKETFKVGLVRGHGHTARKKRLWVWQVTGHTAALVLTQCLPYFIMKRDQAEVALAYQSLIQPRVKPGANLPRVTTEVRQMRTAKMWELRQVRENSCERLAS